MDLWDGWKEMKTEKIVPTCRRNDTSAFHFLEIDVPGFKKDEVHMEHNTGIITVRGERQLNSNIIFFKESYTAPDDSSIEEASGTFKDGVFYINIPKKVASELKLPAGNYDKPSLIALPSTEPEEDERNMVKKLVNQVKNHSTEIIIGVIAFSLGVLVSQGYKRGKGGKRSG